MLRERLDTSEKQIQDLDEALTAERNNFNHVSTTLNHQRKLAASSTDHQSQLIKVRNALRVLGPVVASFFGVGG